jgi:perosamine synthetase
LNIKDKLSYLLGTDITIALFWKGRVALYAILRSLDIRKDDEVILPAFTCVVVPNAIKYLGARPVYADVDPETYTIDLNGIKKKIHDKTKLIIAQNTFGLSSDLDPIMDLAKRRELWVIEDCAHGFGGTYKSRQNGTVTDAAFYSSQWNKPFSTGLGGIAVTRNQEIAEKLKQIESEAIKPTLKELSSLTFQLLAVDYLLNNRTYWPALKLYRWLSNRSLITGSSQGFELEKPIMPDDFLKGFSRIQFKRLKKELGRIEKNITHRKKIAARYKEMLRDLGIGAPLEPEYADHTYIKFPLLVEGREEFFRAAEKARIELGDWFVSPLHPVTDNLALWDYHWGENPVAEWLSQHMVNLPTHMKIGDSQLMMFENFLKNRRGQLIPYDDVRNRVIVGYK